MPSNLKKRKSYKKNNTKKPSQSGGSYSSSPDGMQPFVKTINKRLEYTNNSYLQSQIDKNIKDTLSKVEELHKIGGIIINPRINQLATTERNITEVEKIINMLSKVNEKLREMTEDAKNYIERKKQLSINDDYVSIRFYKNWQKDKNKQRGTKSSGRNKRATASKRKSATASKRKKGALPRK